MRTAAPPTDDRLEMDEASILRQGIAMALECLGPHPFTVTEKETKQILLATLLGEDVEDAAPGVTEQVA